MSITFADTRAWSELALEIGRTWLAHWKVWLNLLAEKLVAHELNLPRVSFSPRQILLWQVGAGLENHVSSDEADERSPLLWLRRETAGSDIVEVVFPEGEVLRPKLRLPKASNAVLRKALHFELARFSPVDPAGLCFDFGTRAVQADGSEVEVAVRAVRRDVADSAIAKCHAAGLKVARFRFAQDDRPAVWTILPVDRGALLTAQIRQWKHVGLAALTLLLLLALLLAVYVRDSEATAAVAAAASDSGRSAAITAHLRKELEALQDTEFFLHRQKQSTPFVALVAGLSKTLPQDTWLTSLQLSGGKIRIAGYSRSASQLLNELAAAGFRKPQFESPLVQDGVQRAQRFDLSAEAPP